MVNDFTKNEIKKSMGNNNHADIGFFERKAHERRKRTEEKLKEKIAKQQEKLKKEIHIEHEKQVIAKERAEIQQLKQQRKAIGSEERKKRAEKIKKVEKGLLKTGKVIGKLFG